MPYERIINLYNAELIYNNIPCKTDLRKYFIQNSFVRFQNMGLSKKEVYKRLMDITGFKDRKNLIKLAFS